MDLSSFKQSLAKAAPPEGLSFAQQALWWDAKGNWDKAHECAQERDDRDGMRVHAYLHRKEGAASNADYWYARAGRGFNRPTLEAEWEALVAGLLKGL